MERPVWDESKRKPAAADALYSRLNSSSRMYRTVAQLISSQGSESLSLSDVVRMLLEAAITDRLDFRCELPNS